MPSCRSGEMIVISFNGIRACNVIHVEKATTRMEESFVRLHQIIFEPTPRRFAYVFKISLLSKRHNLNLTISFRS